MLLVDDLAAVGTKNLRHTPRGLVTLYISDYPTHFKDLYLLHNKFKKNIKFAYHIDNVIWLNQILNLAHW